MKYSPEIVEKIIKYLEEGATITTTCDLVGISKETFYQWVNNKSDFADAIKKAKSIPDKEVENALFKAACGYTETIRVLDKSREQVEIDKFYPPNPISAIFWLKNRKPDSWKDKQEVEHLGSVKTVHDLTPEAIKIIDEMGDKLIDAERKKQE